MINLPLWSGRIEYWVCSQKERLHQRHIHSLCLSKNSSMDLDMKITIVIKKVNGKLYEIQANAVGRQRR